MNTGVNFLQTFNPIESNTELMEHTLIGRQRIVDLLEDLVIEGSSSGNKFQRLIIGPRGSGKTHLLKVLYNRVTTNKELKEKLKIAYLCEDEYGIANFLDFIIRILRAFIRWNKKDSSYLNDELSNLKKVPFPEQEKIAKNLLLNHIKGKTIVVIAENIGNIFEGMGDLGQRKLRDLIQQNPYFMIIASNKTLFKDIQYGDRPFNNFFASSFLEKLNWEEASEFLKAIAEWEGNEDLLNFAKKPEGKGRIHAIYDFTNGNHRLLVTFYNFLKLDYKNSLSSYFLKTINDLIPYYQSFMNFLSPQQQKIVQFLCQNRKPANVKEIAENCFSASNSISKQLHNLLKLEYVDATSSGKETFYELSDPLLRTCFEARENPGSSIKLFIDFLGNLYSADEIKMNLKKLPEFFNSREMQEGKFQLERLEFKKAISFFEKAIEIDRKSHHQYFNIVSCKIGLSHIEEALQELENALKVAKINNINEEILQNFEENLTTLFKHCSRENLMSFLSHTIKLTEKFHYAELFYKAIPLAIFNILRRHEYIEKQHLELIEKILQDTFIRDDFMIFPLKFLNIGIRYFNKKEKNVLLQFTKEERETFKKFVLDRAIE